MPSSPGRRRALAATCPFLAGSPPRSSALTPILETSARGESGSFYDAPGYEESFYELTFMPEVDMEPAAVRLSSSASVGPLQAAPSAGDLAVLAGASSGGYTSPSDGNSVGGSLHGSGAAAMAIAASALRSPLQRMGSALAAALGAALAALSPGVDSEEEEEGYTGAVELPFKFGAGLPIGPEPDAAWD